MIELEMVGLNRFDKISKIVHFNPIYSKDSESIRTVVKKMIDTSHRKIPILSRNRLVGIVAITDILDAFLRKQSFDEKISSIMVRDVIYCDIEETIGFVLQKFKLSRRGSFPVVKDGGLVGMISERDFVKFFSEVRFGKTVEEIMTKKPFFLTSSVSIFDSLKAIVNTKYRRLPIMEKNKVVGIVTAIDILKYISIEGVSLSRPVESIMVKDVVTIQKEEDISEAIRLMKKRDIGGIIVVDKTYKLEGIITERDILEEIV